eukprot:317904_1
MSESKRAEREHKQKTKSLMLLNPDLFVMATTTVFRNLEEERIWDIDQSCRERFNAKSLIELALREDIPWTQYNYWIREKIVTYLRENNRIANPQQYGEPTGRQMSAPIWMQHANPQQSQYGQMGHTLPLPPPSYGQTQQMQTVQMSPQIISQLLYGQDENKDPIVEMNELKLTPLDTNDGKTPLDIFHENINDDENCLAERHSKIIDETKNDILDHDGDMNEDSRWLENNDPVIIEHYEKAYMKPFTSNTKIFVILATIAVTGWIFYKYYSGKTQRKSK